MSVDKKYRISKSSSNFTIIPNIVAQNLNYNLEALGLYVYLFSLPTDWEFYKSHLQKVCNVGIKKLNKILFKLEVHGLVQIEQIREKNGQFSHFSLTVKNGDSFKINWLSQEVQPEGQNCRTAETVATVKHTYKETNTKKQDKEIKINTSCSSEEDEQSSFDSFWKLYPRKQKKKPALDLWKKRKLTQVADKIITAIKTRLETDWKGKPIEFIPLPDTYLNQERWNDEILPISNAYEQKKQTSQVKNNEPRSTVPEFGPGHPTWESMKKWEEKHGKVIQIKEDSHGSEIRRDNSRETSVQKATDYLL